MMGCLTYKNGPSQGTRKHFSHGEAELELQEGGASLHFRMEGPVAKVTVLSGVVMLGAGNNKNRISGEVELREGDVLHLAETRIGFSIDHSVEAPPPPKPKVQAEAEGVVFKKEKKPQPTGGGKIMLQEAKGPAVVIASSRADEEKAPAEEGGEAPKPAKLLFWFLPAEKQKQAYYHLLFVLFGLIIAFTVGAAAGTQVKVPVPKGATLEPYIREALYYKARDVGWDYNRLIQELSQAEPKKERALVVWWLTLPPRKKRFRR